MARFIGAMTPAQQRTSPCGARDVTDPPDGCASAAAVTPAVPSGGTMERETPTFPALRFDGRHAEGLPVVLRVDDKELVVTTADGTVLEHERLDRAVASEPLEHAPRLMWLPNGAILEVPDGDRRFSRELQRARLRRSLRARLQRRWPVLLVAAAGLVAVLAAGYLKALPLVVRWGAFELAPKSQTRVLESRHGVEPIPDFPSTPLAAEPPPPER